MPSITEDDLAPVRHERKRLAAIAVLKAIPIAAREELDVVEAEIARRMPGEGMEREGQPLYGWKSQAARQILVRHGVDPEIVANAVDVVVGELELAEDGNPVDVTEN